MRRAAFWAMTKVLLAAIHGLDAGLAWHRRLAVRWGLTVRW